MEIGKIALLEVMYRVILEIRVVGYKGEREGLSREEAAIVADLADAIHNIPAAICGEALDLSCMLKGFSERHPSYKGVNPYRVYQNSVEGNGLFTKSNC